MLDCITFAEGRTGPTSKLFTLSAENPGQNPKRRSRWVRFRRGFPCARDVCCSVLSLSLCVFVCVCVCLCLCMCASETGFSCDGFAFVGDPNRQKKAYQPQPSKSPKINSLGDRHRNWKSKLSPTPKTPRKAECPLPGPAPRLKHAVAFDSRLAVGGNRTTQATKGF